LTTLNSNYLKSSKEDLVKTIPVRGLSGTRQLNGRPLTTNHYYKRDENTQ